MTKKRLIRIVPKDEVLRPIKLYSVYDIYYRKSCKYVQISLHRVDLFMYTVYRIRFKWYLQLEMRMKMLKRFNTY